MWIYFIEQVWGEDYTYYWGKLNHITREYAKRFWDQWYETRYKWQIVYPNNSMIEGNDYIDY